MADKNVEKSMRQYGGVIIGGCTLIGLGVGFFLLQRFGGPAFVGSLLAGIGVGLVIAGVPSKKR